MFHRKIVDYLNIWKEKENRKPLILRGARQVGKTSAVLLFGKNNFEQTIHINLEKPEHSRLFRQEVSLKEFKTIINISFGQQIIPGKTLVFIDEIQEIPHLVKLLRFFWEEMPQLHVIAAGSLFEVKLKEKSFSIPVGRVEFAYMYPLDFFEYLQATQQQQLLNYLKSITLKDRIPAAIHQQALSSFHEYALIGGMPEAVQQYLPTKDIALVNATYSNLLVSFQDDVYKYSSLANSKYLTFIIDQAPQFAGLPITYEKFSGSNYRSREMAQAFRTLAAAMLLYQVKATKTTKLPFLPQLKKPPKLIFLDVGLVNHQMGIQTEYLQLKDLTSLYQGRIAEQIVGQQLVCSFMTNPPQLFYWYKKTGSAAEVDFCLAHQGIMAGIEVKSGAAGRLRSLHEFIKTTHSSRVLRVYSGLLQTEKNITSLPFYLLPRWQDFL